MNYAAFVFDADRPGVTRRRWVICGLLFAATVINYIDRQMIAVLKPTLQHELGWSEMGYGDIVFWFQAAYALGYLGFGRLADRVGARPPGLCRHHGDLDRGPCRRAQPLRLRAGPRRAWLW